MKLPKHINLVIEHNPHKVNYLHVRQYFDGLHSLVGLTDDDITPYDRRMCEESGEIWEIHWYPETMVGFFRVWASTLERALELANEPS